MAIATDQNNLYLWVPEEPDDPTLMGTHGATISDIAWSPDAFQLVVSDHSGAVSFWSVIDRTLRFRRSGHSDYARSVDWHPNGEIIISGGDDNMLLFWDTLGQITSREEFSTWVMDSDFSASGDQIGLITFDDAFHVLNTNTWSRT